MPRLTKPELARHRTWLSDWRTPAEMSAYVSAVNDAMASADFFRQGGVAFLRDAWLAAEFGRHRQSPLVRLVPEREQWPDFETRAGDVIDERVECAEADLPGRRRGDEYREAEKRSTGGGSLVEDDPIEDWIARADQVPAALSAVISAKIRKRYAGRASLLVNLNISEFGIRQAEIEALMAPAVAPALPCFRRVWVLWKAQLYGPWTADRGQRRNSMAQMTDPTAALIDFQRVFETERIPLQPGVIDPALYVHLDQPTGSPRFTYVRLNRRTVTALVMFAQVPPLKGLPCFQLGVAVPEKYRAQGRAKEIVTAAIAELQNGLGRNGIAAFYIEAVVGRDNEPSQRVAAATISADPVPITDEFSGLPALHYIRKIDRNSNR